MWHLHLQCARDVLNQPPRVQSFRLTASALIALMPVVGCLYTTHSRVFRVASSPPPNPPNWTTTSANKTLQNV